MDNTSTEKTMAISRIAAIHQVDGFDPMALVVEYNDPESGEKHLKLPVMAQMAWFRLIYPEGKISVSTTQVGNQCIGHARVYHHYNDPVECFLAEAASSRERDPENSSAIPLESVQTAAVGSALINAGFGLQIYASGGAAGSTETNNLDGSQESDVSSGSSSLSESQPVITAQPQAEPVISAFPSIPVAPEETLLEKAMKMPCPLTKDGLKGKTLGELISVDPKALIWISEKYTHNPAIAEGARLICEHALAV